MVGRGVGAQVVERVLSSGPAEELLAEVVNLFRHDHRLKPRASAERVVGNLRQVPRKRHVPEGGAAFEHFCAHPGHAVRHHERRKRRAALERHRADVRHRVRDHGHVRLRGAAPEFHAPLEHFGHHHLLAPGDLGRLDFRVGFREKLLHGLDMRRNRHAADRAAAGERIVADVRHRVRQAHRLHLPAVRECAYADGPHAVGERRLEQGRAVPERLGPNISQTRHELELLNPRASLERPLRDAPERLRHINLLKIIHLGERAAPDADNAIRDRHRSRIPVPVVQNPPVVDHEPVLVVGE